MKESDLQSLAALLIFFFLPYLSADDDGSFFPLSSKTLCVQVNETRKKKHRVFLELVLNRILWPKVSCFLVVLIFIFPSLEW